MKGLFVFLLITLTSGKVQDSYQIENFYKKVELDEALDEQGNDIQFVYVKTAPKVGRYAVEITDGDGDLYEVKGYNLYLKFSTYYGYAGYGEEGILIVSQNSYSSKFIKTGD